MSVDLRPMVELRGRRGWLKGLLGASLGAVALSVLYPVARFLGPPAAEEAPPDRVLAARRSGLRPDSGTIFRFGSRPALLLTTASGEVRAFAATCTHLACTVQYRADLGRIWCACHGGAYDLDGAPVAGPPPRPLERYQVTLRGDEIWVSRGRA